MSCAVPQWHAILLVFEIVISLRHAMHFSIDGERGITQFPEVTRQPCLSSQRMLIVYRQQGSHVCLAQRQHHHHLITMQASESHPATMNQVSSASKLLEVRSQARSPFRHLTAVKSCSHLVTELRR